MQIWVQEGLRKGTSREGCLERGEGSRMRFRGGTKARKATRSGGRSEEGFWVVVVAKQWKNKERVGRRRKRRREEKMKNMMDSTWRWKDGKRNHSKINHAIH